MKSVAMIKEKLRVKVAGLTFSGLFTFGIIFGFVAIPLTMKGIISKALQLSVGSETREIYLKPPFPLLFKVYLFNVTNPEEVTSGGKPKLEEVGPYIFE